MWWCKCRRRTHKEGEWCCLDQKRKKLEHLALEKKRVKTAGNGADSVTANPLQNLSNINEEVEKSYHWSFKIGWFDFRCAFHVCFE